MRKLIILLGTVIALLCLLIFPTNAQTKITAMKLNAGFITPKLKQTKRFFTAVLQMEVVIENDFYLLLKTRDGTDQISFLLPNHESQQPLFKPAFAGKGAYLTIEVEDVDAEYERIKALGVRIQIELRDEPWGDRHFTIVDPNDIGIDIIKFTLPEK